ncbi:tumor necrosis factor receptor superfamily member 19-like protein [Labeo rohita]|uniref:Tumor necrosis factor receptor superfamily member 19-like protein n=1 Tax=Labeo rohita TaxID=84645 RepID=A0A498M2Q6_LABRO|nr:tumor necrosis factor receptor superfamily member 19-like protein [Labeo rohita]
MALAAVICSALATVLLALFILCVIYCKRQLLEKKPVSLRSHEGPYVGSELSCLDRRVLEFSQRPCCHCRHGPGQTCGTVHLIPSLCCDDTWSQSRSRETRNFHSHNSLNEGLMNPSLGSSQADVGCAPDEAWPLVQTFATSDYPQCGSESTQRCSSCDEEEERDLQSSSMTPAEPEDGSNHRLLQPQLSATEGERSFRIKLN